MKAFEDKREIRRYVLEKRDSVEQSLREKYDEEIYEKLINSGFYKEASSIFTFVSFKSEVDTKRIINTALASGKAVCVPKIKSKEKGIEIFTISGLNDLRAGYFGVLEPVEECPHTDTSKIDLILMPGVAFDRKGGRVGYGAGFYDRFLAKMERKVPKIALAYDIQVMDKVPTDDFDVSIDGIITNREIILI